MDCSTPGFPVHHQPPEFTQTHVYRVGDAIQPSHPLSPSSPPAFNLSQHQGLFQWISSLHQVAKVLEFQLQLGSYRSPNSNCLYPISALLGNTIHLYNYTSLKGITTNWKILIEVGIPDHLTCLLRNLYAGQEATVRTGHGWQPTPVFLPGESQGQRSLVGCRLWGRTESDTTEVT